MMEADGGYWLPESSGQGDKSMRMRAVGRPRPRRTDLAMRAQNDGTDDPRGRAQDDRQGIPEELPPEADRLAKGTLPPTRSPLAR
jgi:hypothetical protein